MDYHNLTAPDLVKQWKKLVNDYVQMGRDSHMLKQLMIQVTPAQIMLGFYQYRDNRTITIPRFIQQLDDWVEWDETEADIELAVCVSNHVPPPYYIYQDLKEEAGWDSLTQWATARLELKQWAERILG